MKDFVKFKKDPHIENLFQICFNYAYFILTIFITLVFPSPIGNPAVITAISPSTNPAKSTAIASD